MKPRTPFIHQTGNIGRKNKGLGRLEIDPGSGGKKTGSKGYGAFWGLREDRDHVLHLHVCA